MSLFNPQLVRIQFNEPIKYTRNLFGTLDKLKTAILHLSEENESGDCLCIVNGKYLVDIDHRDIKSKTIINNPLNTNVETIIKNIMTMMKRPEENPNFCDGCEHLFMSENNQNLLKSMGYRPIPPDHRCSLTSEILKHNGQHPRIPRPLSCPKKS
jgi:hypothetical protein